MLMPLKERLPPRFSVAKEVEPLFHTAMSPGPGTAAPDQAAGSMRVVALPLRTMLAAESDEVPRPAKAAASKATRAGDTERERTFWMEVGFIGKIFRGVRFMIWMRGNASGSARRITRVGWGG
jgi:hypothetical protein